MDTPTPESMRSNLYTVYYELRMLNEVGLLVRSNSEESKTKRDALLESFLLHVRNLVEFLEGPERTRKGRKNKRDDALWSDDFLDESGKPLQGISVDLPEKDKGDLHKYLSHMTTARVTERTWSVEKIREKVNAAMKEFLNGLTPASFPTHKGKTKQDFERLFDTPPLFGTVRVKSTATGSSDSSTD